MNIFIVSSPLQLLNSIEACSKFKTHNNILVFVIGNNAQNLLIMKKLLNIFRWDKIINIQLPRTFTQQLLYPYFALTDLEAIKKVDKVFVGEYRNLKVNHLVNRLNAKKVILVDDGLATLSIQHKNTIGSNRFRDTIHKLIGYKLKPIEYTVFTIYKLRNIKTIKNDYSFIKSLMQKKTVSDTVYFIGQPLVDLKMLPLTVYQKNLKDIQQFYVNKTIIYIAHRRESEKTLKSIMNHLDIKYIRFDNPLEIEMVLASNIPNEFATFYSSAITTLPLILDNVQFTVFEIDGNSFSISHNELNKIAYCYKEFSKNPTISIQKL